MGPGIDSVRQAHRQPADLIRGWPVAIASEAGDGVEHLEILEKIHPDLVVVDIAMPRLRGLEAARRVKNLYPAIKVLILSMHRSKEYLLQAMAAGVDGYVLKEDADTALHTAIQKIRRGKNYYSPLLSE